MTFRAWLWRQHRRDDRVGDLASDARADKDFPRAVRSLDHLDDYLFWKGACSGAHESAVIAWAEWTAAERKA